MRRRPSALVSAIIAVVLALATVAACGGGGGKPSRPTATTADVPVTTAHGATVRLAGGIRLVIPPGAVSADGRVIARTGGAAVGTSLGLDSRPGAAKPVFAPAGSPVTFELTGARLIHPATLTVPVDPAAFAQAGSAANRPDAAWLAFYDAAGHRWQHVDSRYDPAAHSVTAQVAHLSTWNPFTWDWAAITLRLRQSLSAFGSGRAPAARCAGVQGMTVATAGGNDPPLIACITGDAASGFKVELTNNRAYSVIVQAPPGLVQEPRGFAGFEEFVQSRDMVTKALGGPYLGPVGTVTYDLPASGSTFVFKDSASVQTVVLDMGIAAAEAVFDKVTLGYGSCILDAAAHSQAATLDEAPGLVDECFPALVKGIAAISPGLGWIVTTAQTVGAFVQAALISGDYVFDTALKNHGEIDITRAKSSLLPVAYAPGYSSGTQVYTPEIRPTEFQIWLSPGGGPGTLMTSLTWSRWDRTEAVGSGHFQYGSTTGTIVLSQPAQAADGTPYYSELTISDGQSTQYKWSWSAKEWIKNTPAPSQPLPDFYFSTLFQPEKLYVNPDHPDQMQIDNHEWVAIQALDSWGADSMTMTGVLYHDKCQPDCMAGPMVTYPVQVVASAPQTCTVQIGSAGSETPEQAYVFGKISVRALNGTPPSDLTGDSVFHSCQAPSSQSPPPSSQSPPPKQTPPQVQPEACPEATQLLSAWNAAPTALRDSWAAVQITGFNNITCWNDWVVAVPVSASPGNGVIVFSTAGGLHLITTTELNQQFSQEVCSSPNAPADWKKPPLISCN